MKIQNHKSLLLACALGITLALTGCKTAEKAVDSGTTVVKEGAEGAKDMAEKGAEGAKDMAEKGAEGAKDMAEKGAEGAKDMANKGMDLAGAAFDSGVELTEGTADAAKEKMMSAVTTMEEEFDSMKGRIEGPAVESIQAKFTAIKAEFASLGEKSGAEMLSALNKIKEQGADLAGELKALKDKMVGSTEAKVEGDAAAADGDAASTEAPAEDK